MGTTSFGFKTVDSNQKQGLVKSVFDSVASRYDIMNDVMSAGMHRLWKETFVNRIPHKKPLHVLDVAGGTGDIAFRILQKHPSAHVKLTDINHAMLEEGRCRRIDRNIKGDLEILCANAQHLPLPDNSMDVYTIAFGIRNVTDRAQALAEAYRVLKPGGVFLCLEFSHTTNPLLTKCYDLYSFKLIPTFGKVITGSADPYQYLVESIRMFPDQESFKSEIQQAGFDQVDYTNLTHGVVAIHSGWKV